MADPSPLQAGTPSWPDPASGRTHPFRARPPSYISVSLQDCESCISELCLFLSLLGESAGAAVGSQPERAHGLPAPRARAVRCRQLRLCGHGRTAARVRRSGNGQTTLGVRVVVFSGRAADVGTARRSCFVVDGNATAKLISLPAGGSLSDENRQSQKCRCRPTVTTTCAFGCRSLPN